MRNGNYILSCQSTEMNGWIDSFVRIGHHQFCDDYTNYNSMITLNIRGERSYIEYFVLLPVNII